MAHAAPAEEDVVPFSDPMHAGPARPGARRRAAIMLVVATLFATVIGAAIFWAVLQSDAMTGPAQSVMGFLFRHSAVAMALACSPLFAAMLVGYGYMQRALKRRQKARLEREAAKAA